MNDDRQGEVSEVVERREPELMTPRIVRFSELREASVTPIFGPEVRVVKRRVLDDLSGLERVVERARESAEAIVERARREAEEIRASAREEGRDEGHREWAEALSALRSERERVVREAEGDLLELSVRLAGRIVGRKVEVEPETAAEIVAETLQHVRGDEQIVVHVHPDDVQSIALLRDELARLAGALTLFVEADPEVSRGGCVIVTDRQRIDARLEVQLEQMRRQLRGDR